MLREGSRHVRITALNPWRVMAIVGIIMCFTVTRGGVKSCFGAVGRESRFARYQGHGLELPLVRGVGSDGW